MHNAFISWVYGQRLPCKPGHVQCLQCDVGDQTCEQGPHAQHLPPTKYAGMWWTRLTRFAGRV